MNVPVICHSLFSLSNWADVNIAALWRTNFENKEDAPSYRTLRSWYSRGTKLARLAEGGKTCFTLTKITSSTLADVPTGSVYMLLWLAHTDLRAPYMEADGTLAADIANALRCPEHSESQSFDRDTHVLTRISLVDSSVGRTVRDKIIPTVAYLSAHYPVQLGDVLPNDIVSALGVSPTQLCCDLDASDRLFSALPSK